MSLMSLMGYAATVKSFKKVIESAIPAEWITGTDVPYAPYVEFGTSKMEAQPHLSEGVKRTEKKMDELRGQADSVSELIKLVALQIERETKNYIMEERDKDGSLWETGNLHHSYKARKLH